MLRISSLLFAVVISLTTYSQETSEKTQYKPSFGFNFGLNYSLLWNQNQTSLLTINNGVGLRLGVISEFPIGTHWAISPKAELSFNNGKIIQNDITYHVDPANLDFMLHFKHSLKGYNGKVKPFFTFGPNFRVPVRGDYLNGPFYDTRAALAFDISFGTDIELKHFMISPELRFSAGLTDIRQNPTGRLLHGSNAALIINFSSK